jgi:peptidoglycan hydrolase CwlO-like protein
MRLRHLAMAVTLLLVLPALGGASSLSSRIQEKQRQVEAQRAQEGVLTADIRGYSDRIGSLQSDITVLQTKETRLQADLDGKLARLAAIQRDLRTERARLARLRVKLAEGERLLAARLVDLYKADSPDLVTVVLNSHGFADLLENSEFARRVGRQDNRIITAVREAKRESTISAARFAGLAADARQLAAVVQDRRDEVADVKSDLVSRRDEYSRARARKNTVLASVRSDRQDLEGDLKALQAQEARIQARLAGVPAAIGPVRAGSGGLIWPPARRGRHRGPVGDGGARRGERQRAHRRVGQRLRQLRLHPALRAAVHLLRPQHEPRRVGRPVGLAGPGDLELRLHGPLLRPARPLRDAHQRRAGGPHELSLAP